MNLKNCLTERGTDLTFIFLISLVCASSATAQIENVVVQIKGLACPFCVRGIEKHIKKIDGVTSVETNLKKGETSPLSKETLAALRKLIHRKDSVRVTGIVHSHKDFPPGISLEKWEDLGDE